MSASQYHTFFSHFRFTAYLIVLFNFGDFCPACFGSVSDYPYSFQLPEPDTSYQDGDTVAIYSSGWDTTYEIYFEPIPDSLLEEGWVINNPHKEMVVELSHLDAEVNEGVYGINLTDFFENGHANADDLGNYDAVPDPWQAVADLAPRTIRVFSGSGGKFMHPLGYYDEDDDINYGGYGFFWKEIVPFYDITIPPLDADFGVIATELGGDYHCGVGECTWIDEPFREDFAKFYQKSVEQQGEDLYIDQFIDLINYAQTENNDYTIDVIYCVNILSESASEMIDVIDYLWAGGVNVIGVELGNEVYFDFQVTALGFSDFHHYWEYIHGVEDYSDVFPGDDFELEDVLPPAMVNDHDYIQAIKGDADYWDLKIGIPAANTPNCGLDWDFPLGIPDGEELKTEDEIEILAEPLVDPPCPCYYPDWNAEMISHYDEITTVGMDSHYDFDAIVFHPYYAPTNNSGSCAENSNWRDILLALYDGYDPEDFPDISDTYLSVYQYTGEWDYIQNSPPYDPTSPDSRLIEAFDNLVGIHYPLSDSPLIHGNYKEFTRDRLDLSFGEHAAQMLFTSTDDDPQDKEVWITEKNLDDKIVLPSGTYKESNQVTLQFFESAATNSFAHAAMLSNWFMWDIRASFYPLYRDYFLTRVTLQNLLGGSTIDLMTQADAADEDLVGEIATCSTAVETPLYLGRASFLGALLWRMITDNHLHYMKSTTTMASLNNNLAPVVFVEEGAQKVYLFYTNVTSDVQKYYIAPGTLVNDYGGDEDFEIELLSYIESLILDADQIYSTAGRSSLFNINSDYTSTGYSIDDCESVSRENRFELTGLTDSGPEVKTCPAPFIAAAPGGLCIEVPAVSMGWVMIPFDVNALRKGNPDDQFALFPNPAFNYFIVQQKTNSDLLETDMRFELYSLSGNLIQTAQVDEGEIIDISKLPVGVYQVLIIVSDQRREWEELVKMK